ncbi:proclotting enzyme-like [Ixodes scapularis]|uniref:proclotting enzyme-like n=1 Tax=Ixodes scapularis TaxID=6945 RepID=UPI001A9E046C|nr:proclotting enzyme-like [Ixodes scapularis]
MSRVLLETTVPILAHEDCAKSYQGLLDIDENHLCAGTSAGDRDACKGDSGGPLMLPDEDQRFSVIGVTSFGVQCGDSDFPGVYTRVSRYLKWITSKLETLGAS